MTRVTRTHEFYIYSYIDRMARGLGTLGCRDDVYIM